MVRKNFILVLRVVLLLCVVSSYARFSTMVTKSEVNRICTQKGVNNASSCLEFLNSSSHEIAALDLSGLAKFLIKYDSNKTSDMLNQFQSLKNSTADPSAKGSYQVCSETFDLAVGCFDTALKSLEAKDYDTLNINIGSTISTAFTCRDELLTVKPRRPELLSEISNVANLSSIVLTILECFLRKEKKLC
ncbi:hypothetical protein Bca4012_063978 [Brassica carinata]